MRAKKFLVLLLFVALVITAFWISQRGLVLSDWEYVKARPLAPGVLWQQIPDPTPYVDDSAWQKEPPRVEAHWLQYVARKEFSMRARKDAYYALETNWRDRLPGRLWLNGQEIGPCEGLSYGVIPGIPSSSFKDGLNVLVGAVEVYTRDLAEAMKRRERPRALSMRLRRQDPSELNILIGPTLGWFDEDGFTVSAAADFPVEWSCQAGQGGFDIRAMRTEPCYIQTFEVRRTGEVVAPSGNVSYTLRARLPGRNAFVTEASGSVDLAPLGTEWGFVMLGDSRSNPQRWKTVARAAAAKKPRFIVHSGDFVDGGSYFRQWIDQFSEPARSELATIPFYAVVGNHEANSPLLPKIIVPPGPVDHWAQRQGPVLLVGIDGSRDWSEGSELYRWLEKTLSESRAPFILVVSHYPVLSSSVHSKLNAEGAYLDRRMRQARQFLMPLCAKYHVTAFVGGHEHCYERSEAPGLTALTSGGAGASNYRQRPDWKERNPYSTFFYAGLNYMVFTVKPDELRVEALKPEGDVLDHREWKVRPESE